MTKLFLLALTTATSSISPKTPAEAIAIADAHPNRGTTGVYQMTVAAAEQTPTATYLNSSEDYRSADDLTFKMRPIVAATLRKRFGASPEIYLRGKTVTVKGAVRAIPIANQVAGRAHDLARYQHVVMIDTADQVLTVK